MNTPYSLVLLGIFVFTILSCGTTGPTMDKRIPERSQPSPTYDTQEVLLERIQKLEKKLSKNPDDSELMLQLAALYQDVGQIDKALSYMETIDQQGPASDPRLYGSMANIYASRDQHSQSLAYYKKFRAAVPDSSPTAKKIEDEIAQQEFIIMKKSNADNINLKPFPSPINTEYSEYLLQWTLDESQVIFTRRLHGQEDLIAGTWDGETYTTEAITELNGPLNEGAHTISVDGTILIYTFSDKRAGLGSRDLFRAKKLADGTWSKPVNMGNKINSRFWDGQPSLSADGKFLYFISNREGGQGGRDIWASKKQKDGRWSQPINLGPQVNTAGNEESPFIHADGRSLYFRSNGRMTMGGHDIYKTTLQEGKWQEPIHLGSPINTTGEDGALVISLDGTKGYYATDNYKGTKSNHLDLYQFNLPQTYRPLPMTFVKGTVTDKDTKYPIKAVVKISYLDDSGYTAFYRVGVDGTFLAAVPVGTPTLMHVSADEYAFFSDHIAYDEVRYSVDPYMVDIALEKVKPEVPKEEPMAPIVLRNIFFETGSAELLPTSTEEINTVFTLLEDRPDITIQIIGHTDNVGTDEANLQLSIDRAESVRQALIDKGAAADRITAQGLGESRPIESNATKEGRARNRRTEMVINN